jgi:DMSO/TMAO reductase YedYZ molybdopterin-dependent catalytic subunit
MRRRFPALAAVLLFSATPLSAQLTGLPSSSPPEVDISRWRLSLTGAALGSPAVLTYEDLMELPTVTHREHLVCPGLFGYFADWEGVPLSALLMKGMAAGNYSKITFIALDGYSSSFTREEVESSLLFLALKVHGRTLPPAEGYPVRLVAGDFTGGKWVRWLKEIRVE